MGKRGNIAFFVVLILIISLFAMTSFISGEELKGGAKRDLIDNFDSSSSSGSGSSGSSSGGDSVTNVYNTYVTDGDKDESLSETNNEQTENDKGTGITGGIIGTDLLSGWSFIVILGIFAGLFIVVVISRTILRIKKIK